MQKISAIIITYNEESRIRFALESVQWCDEIIVIDSNSTDKTVEICKDYSNCNVYIQPFLGYRAQKKYAVEKASNDWILSIDSDEMVTAALRDEILVTLSKSDSFNAGFYVPITLIFMKRIFRFGCENKQFHLRLFNRNKGTFNTLNLHESVKVCGPVAKLKHEILHISYTDTQYVSFGLHTFGHISLKSATFTDIAEDIHKCKQELTLNGVNYLPILAYPYGAYPKNKYQKKAFFELLESLGIEYGLRIGNRVNKWPIQNRFEMKRIDMKGTDSFWSFKTKLKKGRVKMF